MVKASAHVAVKPKRVVCFMTKRFARMHCVHINAISACDPKKRAMRALLVITTECARKIISFSIKTTGFHSVPFLI